MQKPLNVWFYVFLSLIPFLNIYPLKKLKKLWKMFFIDLGITLGAYLISFVMIEYGFKIKNGALLPISCAMPLYVVVQAICVYNWVKEKNQLLHV